MIAHDEQKALNSHCKSVLAGHLINRQDKLHFRSCLRLLNSFADLVRQMIEKEPWRKGNAEAVRGEKNAFAVFSTQEKDSRKPRI